ncbi:MAG: phage tail assembly protein T [Bacillota bacterium]
MAYYRLEPWGTGVEDLRAGIVASTVANANRDPKRRRRPFAPQDFMPTWDRGEAREQSPEEQFRIIQALHTALSAKHK